MSISGKTATEVTSEKVECRTKKLIEQICSLQSEKATVTAGLMTLQANLDTRKGHQEKEVKELKVSAEKILKERDDLEEKITEMEAMKVITDNNYNYHKDVAYCCLATMESIIRCVVLQLTSFRSI